MNREKIINLWTFVLVVLELGISAVQVLNADVDLPGVYSMSFMFLLVVVCCLASLQAKAGWFVFLRASWISFLLMWVARPLFQIWAPDVLMENSGSFSQFMMLFGVVSAIATIVYVLIIPSFFSSTIEDLWKLIPVFDLSPSKGKTVRELEGGIDLPPRELAFGEADRELSEHWRGVGKEMLALSARRRKVFLIGGACLLAWPVLIYVAGGGDKGSFDRDVERMWEVQPRLGADGRDLAEEYVLNDAKARFVDSLQRKGISKEAAQAEADRVAEIWRRQQDHTGVKQSVVPTQSALNAAKRVFANELAFRGLTRLDARKLLGIEKKNERYLLDKPEFSWEADQLLLRMDNGVKSVSLLAGYDDAGLIRITWPRESGAMIPNLEAVEEKK